MLSLPTLLLSFASLCKKCAAQTEPRTKNAAAPLAATQLFAPTEGMPKESMRFYQKVKSAYLFCRYIFSCVALCILTYPPINRNVQFTAFQNFFSNYSTNLLRQARIQIRRGDSRIARRHDVRFRYSPGRIRATYRVPPGR